MLAYVFTAGDVVQGLDDIEAAMRGLAQVQGYQVVDGDVVGKNAKTGQDAPAAQKTTTWGTPVELTDGRMAVASYRDYLAREVEGVPLYTHVDNAISVPWSHEDVTALLPPEPDPEE